MKLMIVAKYNFYTPWSYYLKAAQDDFLVVAGPGQPFSTMEEALLAHPNLEGIIVFTTGYFPSLKIARDMGIPTIYRILNTHGQWQRHLAYAQEADIVLVPQLWAVKELGAFHPRVYWLPYGVDPAIYRPFPEKKRYDVVFCGNYSSSIYQRRRRLLELIAGKYRLFCKEKIFHEEAARLYQRGKIVFNESLDNEVNMRTFEVLACKSFLLTNISKGTGLAILFKEGEDLVTYSESQLLDLLAYYLEREDLRKKIANNGYQKVLGFHTYQQRWETMKKLLKGEGYGYDSCFAKDSQRRINN